MTVAEAQEQAFKECPAYSGLPASVVTQLADVISGSAWSTATVKPGLEKQFIRKLVKMYQTKNLPDEFYTEMEAMMTRPTLN